MGPQERRSPIPPAPKETPESWSRRIRGGEIPPVLYLHGEDEGRILSFMGQVRGQCLKESSQAFNLNVFDASEAPMERILGAAQTLPVFSSRRVVVVSNASSVRKSDWEQALPYLKDPSPSTCLIFRAEKVPELREVVQAIASHGALIEFRPRTGSQAEDWIKQRVRREGKKIQPDATQALVERVGTREGDLEAEIQKLLAYVGAGAHTIRCEDVLEVSAEARIHRVFDLTDALAERRTSDALRILHRLLEDGAPPLAILGMMVRQLRLLWSARDAMDRGRERTQWARHLSIPPFLRERLLRQARTWGDAALWRAFQGLARLDRAFKGGGLDPEVLMDNWILMLGQVGRGEDPSRPTRRGG